MPHLEYKQTQDPTLQISSVQACDNPSTDANDSVHDVPSLLEFFQIDLASL
jgi:hypothetical protein